MVAFLSFLPSGWTSWELLLNARFFSSRTLMLFHLMQRSLTLGKVSLKLLKLDQCYEENSAGQATNNFTLFKKASVCICIYQRAER